MATEREGADKPEATLLLRCNILEGNVGDETKAVERRIKEAVCRLDSGEVVCDTGKLIDWAKLDPELCCCSVAELIVDSDACESELESWLVTLLLTDETKDDCREIDESNELLTAIETNARDAVDLEEVSETGFAMLLA